MEVNPNPNIAPVAPITPVAGEAGPQFDYNSMRSREARLTVGISPTMRNLLRAVGWGLLACGAMVVIAGVAIGWILVALSVPPLAVYQWWRHHLYRLEIINDERWVDNILSSSVLGRLPHDPQPKDIAEVIGKTSSGMFLTLRFGITSNFLQELATASGATTDQIWQLAVDLRQETRSYTLSAGTLAIAIIKALPNHDGILAHLQLDFNDLLEGVKWHDYLHLLKDELEKPRKTGGIGRDWSFGYIPTLSRYGINISEQLGYSPMMTAKIPQYQAIVEQMIDLFSSGGRQNVALVGDEGAGKTTLVYAFASRLLDADSRVPDQVKFRQVIILDASSLIASAPGRGELEHLIMQILSETYSAENVILCLDNAQVFFEEGVGTVDLTNVLLPILEAGRVRMILTMNEQRLMQIAQKNPGLANALNRIRVEPTDFENTMMVMQNKVLGLENNMKVLYMYQALKEAYRLSERYIYDLVMPGRAIKLLEASAHYSENGLVSVQSVHQAIESTMNVKISQVDQAEEREKLLNLEELIHQRMINQRRAVEVVSNALRRARAGVRNPNKPMGTFLFLGPTGVGKTELSKALADVYFGGEDNIVRIDLNEYVTINDVARLLADGANNPNSLTAQIMQRPFSVVLLDEIEKAHPAVLTTLLQLLDEGILRDENNREVSFRDAVVIATSNAGADMIRAYIEQGYSLEAFEKQITEELITSGQFKPEFINRFDEIVVFRPLDKSELLQVLDLILNGVNKTLANRKVTIEVDPQAKAYLVDVGYDPRLGARPMRRVVQATVENIVAKQMIAYGGSAMSGQTIQIDLAQIKAIVEAGQSSSFINPDQPSSPPAPSL